MDSNSNTLKDLFSVEEMREYVDTAYPFSIAIIDRALKAKLQENPDYEVWVPAVYYKYAKTAKPGTQLRVDPPYIFVSNKGRVCRNINGDVKVFKPFMGNEDGYWHISYATNVTVGLHRLIGCCFVPVTDQHPKDTQINHIDGDKLNYELSNLEWLTHQDNMDHARKTKLMPETPKGALNHKTKPVKGIILFGQFKDYEFILAGDEDRVANGFTPSLITMCCKGKNESHRHCKWSYATEDEVNLLPKGITLEMQADLNRLSQEGTEVLLATNVISGETITIPYTLEAIEAAGFGYKSVRRVLNGQRKVHKSCTFEKIAK